MKRVRMILNFVSECSKPATLSCIIVDDLNNVYTVFLAFDHVESL